MYFLLPLAQNLPTELQVCPHPQTHWVGVFWGQAPVGLAVSQVKILLGPSSMPTAAPRRKMNLLPCPSLPSHRLLIGTHITFRAMINAIQARQQRDVHQYGRYNIEPGLQGTVDDPATFFIRLISSVQIHDPMQLKEDVPSAKTFHTSEHKSTVSASDLSERWFIGLKQATQTIKSTSQWLLRLAISPLAKKYRADRMYKDLPLRGVVYTNTMHGHFKFLDGNKYTQIFSREDYFVAAYAMESKALASDALKEFITKYGMPDKIIMDVTGEQTGKRSTFMEQVREHLIDHHVT